MFKKALPILITLILVCSVTNASDTTVISQKISLPINEIFTTLSPEQQSLYSGKNISLELPSNIFLVSNNIFQDSPRPYYSNFGNHGYLSNNKDYRLATCLGNQCEKLASLNIIDISNIIQYELSGQKLNTNTILNTLIFGNYHGSTDYTYFDYDSKENKIIKPTRRGKCVMKKNEVGLYSSYMSKNTEKVVAYYNQKIQKLINSSTGDEYTDIPSVWWVCPTNITNLRYDMNSAIVISFDRTSNKFFPGQEADKIIADIVKSIPIK